MKVADSSFSLLCSVRACFGRKTRLLELQLSAEPYDARHRFFRVCLSPSMTASGPDSIELHVMNSRLPCVPPRRVCNTLPSVVAGLALGYWYSQRHRAHALNGWRLLDRGCLINVETLACVRPRKKCTPIGLSEYDPWELGHSDSAKWQGFQSPCICLYTLTSSPPIPVQLIHQHDLVLFRNVGSPETGLPSSSNSEPWFLSLSTAGQATLFGITYLVKPICQLKLSKKVVRCPTSVTVERGNVLLCIRGLTDDFIRRFPLFFSRALISGRDAATRRRDHLGHLSASSLVDPSWSRLSSLQNVLNLTPLVQGAFFRYQPTLGV